MDEETVETLVARTTTVAGVEADRQEVALIGCV